MSDEIAQVCKIELEVGTFLVKASVEVAKKIAQMLNSLSQWGKARSEQFSEWKMNKGGEKSIKDIIKLSEPDIASKINIKEDVWDDFAEQLEAKGFHYATLIDFDTTDKLKPILVPQKELEAIRAIYESCTRRKSKEERAELKKMETQCAEHKEKLRHETDPAKKESMEVQIENMHAAIKEIKDDINVLDKTVIDSKKGKKEGATTADTLVEYLKESKGTSFEENPARAVAELEKGIDISKKMTAKEFMQPLRAKCNVPKENLSFIIPDTGSVITRVFCIDEKTNIVYSNYLLKNESGENVTFTDKDMTTEKWNAEELAKVCDAACILQETPCTVISSEEKMQIYLKEHGNVKSNAEIQVEKAINENREVFSNAEVKSQIETSIMQEEKRETSAKITNNKVVIEVEPQKVFRQNGKVVVGLNVNETLMFSNISNETVSKGKMVFEVDKDAQVAYVKNDENSFNQNMTLTGEESAELIENMFTSKAGEMLSNTKTNGR